MDQKKKNSLGKIIRYLVILAVFVLGGGYAGSEYLDKENTGSEVATQVQYETTTAATQAIEEATAAVTESKKETKTTATEAKEETTTIKYRFRKDSYWEQHFEKHGGEFDYSNKEEYLEGANKVIANKNTLHKTEKEDGDDVYFLESTGEFVVVSTDGYLRTYFIPSAGIDYFNRQ